MRAIVFVLRGCPAGFLGAYGNEWVGTPTLDRLAAEGVAFDRHVSDCPDPAAAGRAWLTGRNQTPAIPEPNPPAPFPERSGVRGQETGVSPEQTAGSSSPPFLGEGPGEGSRPQEPHVLLAALRDADVRTVVVRANRPDTDAPAPFYAGWDEVFDARPHGGDPSPLDALIRAFPSLLDRLGTVPRWLIWVEIDRLVPPWDVPQDVFTAYAGDEDEGDEPEEDDEFDEVDGEDDEPDEDEDEPDDIAPAAAEPDPVAPFAGPVAGPFDPADLVAWERLRSTFAAVVTKLDAELGGLVDELQTRGLDQTAAWLVTSDHGYPLGEHGQVGVYRPWLHEELVHLPLVVRLPGAADAGRRVPALTQPADLAATLLELFAAPPVESVHGRSLLPLVRGEAEAVRDYACTGLAANGATEWAIRTPEWAYLLPGQSPPDDPPREPQLFEKPDDRWEVNDLRSQNAERAERLHDVLTRFAAAVQHPGPLVVPPLNDPASAG